MLAVTFALKVCPLFFLCQQVPFTFAMAVRSSAIAVEFLPPPEAFCRPGAYGRALWADHLFPTVRKGDYFYTCPAACGALRCTAYTAPLAEGGGTYICTIEHGQYLGPVQEYAHSVDTTAIKVAGAWIDVWTWDAYGIVEELAYRIPSWFVQQTEEEGFQWPTGGVHETTW